ncbi:peptidoglycan DD-metalloendopeptidase family protein [Chloroflexota bacterium]
MSNVRSDIQVDRPGRTAGCKPAVLVASQCAAVLVLLVLLANPAAAQKATPEPPVYVVQRGDTLFGIAQRFDTTVQAIVAANDLADRSLIITGQKLVIPTEHPELVPSSDPAPNVRVHPVRPGETLPFLAFRYGTTVWALQESNDVHRLGFIWPGQKLTIPPPTAVITSAPVFPEITAGPAPVVQGRTVLIEVQSLGDLDLRGRVLDQDLQFAEEDGRYWALAGVGAMAPPGSYPLTLTATEADSGDLLTMHETITVTAGEFSKYNIVVPADRSGLLAPSVSNAEREKLNQVFGRVSEERLWVGTFDLPLEGEPRTTASFGQRRSYNGGSVSSYHSGHDYGADAGEPVMAPITGTVVMAEPLQVRGKVVILDHGLGVFTGFWHLSRIDVEVGQVVGRGEVVGLVGNSGLSTGAHLHWEMRVNNVPVQPLQWTRQAFP